MAYSSYSRGLIDSCNQVLSRRDLLFSILLSPSSCVSVRMHAQCQCVSNKGDKRQNVREMKENGFGGSSGSKVACVCVCVNVMEYFLTCLPLLQWQQ